jgi:uncharacterized protein (TIGR04255 family)
MEPTPNPMALPPPPERPLARAPLVRVIAQLRFPEVLSIERREFVAPFQDSIRAAYPVLRQDHTHGLLLTPAGVGAAKPQVAWRFSDLEGVWRVSLTPGFVALETTRYASRGDFLARLRAVLQALGDHVQPAQLDRIGIRYVDRLTGAPLESISALVRPEVRGLAGTGAAGNMLHSLSETMFESHGARLLARWGCLPPEGTLDPAAIEPIAEPSWILDLDMFSTGAVPFAIDPVVEQARRYAERIYTVFRWAVTDEFLNRFGAQP